MNWVNIPCSIHVQFDVQLVGCKVQNIMGAGSIGQTSNVSLRPALMRCRGNLEAVALHFSTKPLLQMVTHIMPATLLFYFNPISEMTLILC